MVVEWEAKHNEKLSRLAYIQTQENQLSTRGKATANSVEIHCHLSKPASGNTGMMPPQQSKKGFEWTECITASSWMWLRREAGV